jgi:hypothetical protein
LRVAPDVLWVLPALPMIAALGLVPALLVMPLHPPLRHERAGLLALAGACGLLVNYALGTLLPDLRWVLAVGCAIAAAALTWALALHRRALLEMLAMGWARWLLVVGLLLAFAGAILFESLRDWDARSVWFFAAKRLFFSGGLGAGPADWTLPPYGFSHADYPKLLPLLAAQFADAWGLWNEYIPKASLLVLLLPVIVGLLGLPRRLGLSLVFLAAVLLLSTGKYLWNGYADSYLCLYAALSLVYLARWLGSSEPLDLALGSAFMGVAVNLKNEGALLALCVVACLAAWLALARRARVVNGWRNWPAGLWLALLLPWIGFAGWALTRQQWQLANDLQLGAGSVQRVLQRLAEGQLPLVARTLVLRADVGKSAALLLTSAALAWALRSRVPATAWFPAAVASLYLAGMFLVYLATPHDVAWHLATSAERTMLLAAFGYLGSTFLVLEAMESRSPATAASVERRGLQT